MGLPIWRDPEERTAAVRPDPTAAARSSIRRRPSIHGGRNRSRLARETTLVRPPRLERSPPPTTSSSQSRRAGRAGVPPISTLLEQANLEPADRLLPPPPPPPVPHSRNYYSLEQRERDIRDGLDSLHARAEQLQRDAQSILSEGRLEAQEARELGTSLGDLNRALGGTGHSSRPGLRREGSAHSETSGRPRSSTGRPQSQNQASAPRSVLPTPPLDQSEPDLASQPESYTTNRPSHPLSRSWRPESPINGLGDRNRSPTPTDAWEIMRSTIAPDENLPSADSSFASAAANSSFASAADTTITEPEAESTSESSRRTSDEDDESSEGESVSSVDADDLCAEDDMISETEQFAMDMYIYEMESAEGRQRIVQHSAARDREGDRYALAREAPHVDIGFRLIEDALETEEGRARMVAAYGDNHAATGDIDRVVRFRERRELNQRRRRRTRGEHLDSPRSPPPRYSSINNSHPDEMATLISRDAPEPHPVSPPSSRSMHDVGGSLLGDIDDLQDDIQDLEQMRRVVERLASRDDVPDEWWMSMGLNLSRTRVRSEERQRRRRSPDGVRRSDVAGGRVASGRVERGTSRL